MFTENPRRLILGNWASARYYSRKPKGRECITFVFGQSLLRCPPEASRNHLPRTPATLRRRHAPVRRDFRHPPAPPRSPVACSARTARETPPVPGDVASGCPTEWLLHGNQRRLLGLGVEAHRCRVGRTPSLQ